MGREKSGKRKAAKVATERVPFDRVRPAPYNPRAISDEARRGLDASLDRFGYVAPMVWNRRTGNLVGGHQRFDKLVRDGYTEADFSVVDVDEATEKALNVTLNNPAVQGVFTDSVELLLSDIEVAFDTQDFENLGLDRLLEKVNFDGLEGFKKPDVESDISSDRVKEDGNWFFVEFYGKDDLFLELEELLGEDNMRTKHEIEAEIFVEMVRKWRDENNGG